jgi:hypothetical protein
MCNRCGCNLMPPRGEPAVDPRHVGEVPSHMLSDSALHRRGRTRTRLPAPPIGTVERFPNRQLLVARFRTIPNRGQLYNADPSAFRRSISDAHRDGPPVPLEAWTRAILNIETAPANFIYLLEETPGFDAVMMGVGMARRATVSTPPEERPIGHNVAMGAHGQAIGNAIGLGLDYLASISIAVAERIHHAVVVYTPAPTLGGSADQDRGVPYHFVLWRPVGMVGNDTRLMPWQLAPPAQARQYLT